MAMSCALNVFAFREGERGSEREKMAVSVIFEAYLDFGGALARRLLSRRRVLKGQDCQWEGPECSGGQTHRRPQRGPRAQPISLDVSG